MRGLKPRFPKTPAKLGVAPHTGAWIETASSWLIWSIDRSHPTRVRGLKPAKADFILDAAVAPHTGAWIETWLTP